MQVVKHRNAIIQPLYQWINFLVNIGNILTGISSSVSVRIISRRLNLSAESIVLAFRFFVRRFFVVSAAEWGRFFGSLAAGLGFLVGWGFLDSSHIFPFGLGFSSFDFFWFSSSSFLLEVFTFPPLSLLSFCTFPFFLSSSLASVFLFAFFFGSSSESSDSDSAFFLLPAGLAWFVSFFPPFPLPSSAFFSLSFSIFFSFGVGFPFFSGFLGVSFFFIASSSWVSSCPSSSSSSSLSSSSVRGFRTVGCRLLEEGLNKIK